jgi:hypothetical protein
MPRLAACPAARSGALAVLVAAAALGCSGPEEAARVDLAVVAESSGVVPVETDLGYMVQLEHARVLVVNLEFNIAGEAHVSLLRRLSDFLVPRANAHPGHFQGGDVTGELRGRFVLEWAPGRAPQPIGTATLLVGAYESADFTFGHAAIADGLAGDDPLLGHTAVLTGTASRQGATWTFDVVLDAPEGRRLTGAPFRHAVTESSREALGLRLLTQDPLEGDSLFDGLDFGALDADADGHVAIGPGSTEEGTDAYDQIRRTFQTHDHFDVQALPGE